MNQEKYAEAVPVFHRLIPLSRKLDSRYEASSYEELYKAWFELGNMDVDFGLGGLLESL